MEAPYVGHACLLALCLAGAIADKADGSQSAQSQPTALPAEIESALRSNANQLDPITVSWTVQNRTDIPAEQAIANMKVGPGFFASSTHSISFQHGKIYAGVDSTDGSKNEVSFDGQILYIGNSSPSSHATLSKRINAAVIRGEHLIGAGREGTWLADGYFGQAGLQVPSTSLEMQAGQANSVVLWLLQIGATVNSIQTETTDGMHLVRLWLVADDPERKFADQTDRQQIERFALGMSRNGRQRLIETWEQQKKLPLKRDHVFYLDPRLSYAVVRSQDRYGDRLLSETINESFEQVPGRTVWLPRRSVTRHFTNGNNPGVYSDTPIYSHVIELKEMKILPVPDERFALDYRTLGTQITDQTVPGKPLSYDVRAGSAPPTRAVPGGRTAGLPQGYQPLANVPEAPQSSERYSSVVWTVGAIVAALALIGAWRWRHAIHDGSH